MRAWPKPHAARARSVASIHEQTRSKEARPRKLLRYDRWPRHSFRLLLFPGNEDARGLPSDRARGKRVVRGGSVCRFRRRY